MPSTDEQLESARSRAIVVPAADLAVLRVTGKDRLTWLNGLLTCEVSKLAPGAAVYGLFVERKGRIIVDAVTLADDTSARVIVPRAEVERVRAWLDEHLIMEDAELSLSDEGVFFAHGPLAPAALEQALAAGATGARLDRTGLGGAVIAAGADVVDAARAAMVAAGAVLGSDDAWEILRHERHVARFGVDFDGALYPQEASLEGAAVSFDKGCYLGQEVVYMLQSRGHVKRKIVPLALEPGDVPERGAPVTTTAGDVVGAITSGAPSKRLGGPIAFAMVKSAHAAPTAALRVGERGARVMAEPV
jgi:hypothetical protein